VRSERGRRAIILKWLRLPVLSQVEAERYPNWTLLAANEPQDNDQPEVQSDTNADESAKMGKESGTHTGDEALTPENDTKKVDQQPRQNPTTGG
jgi:hypothetical protein